MYDAVFGRSYVQTLSDDDGPHERINSIRYESSFSCAWLVNM